MERFGATCSGKLLAIWGLYSLVVTVLCSAIQAAGWPDYLGWLMAAGLAISTLLATSEL
jgi:hypothetical protein